MVRIVPALKTICATARDGDLKRSRPRAICPPRLTVSRRIQLCSLDSATALLANEMFRPDGTMDKDAGARSAQELLALARSCRHLVCVCDDLWRDGQDYDPWTEEYRRQLAGICRKLAAEFDAVAEVICGLPQFYKHGKDVI